METNLEILMMSALKGNNFREGEMYGEFAPLRFLPYNNRKIGE